MGLPYFPLYPTDFDGKTAHLTILEDGAYNRLLRLCWKTPGCRIPTDEAWIMRQMRARTNDEQEAVRSVIAEFFTAKGGFYTNKKLSEIYDASRDAHERRKNAGSKGGKAKALKTNKTEPSNAVAMAKQPEPEPDIKETPNGVSKKKRATRLPEDWFLPRAWGEWAQAEGFSADTIRREADKFKDYWISQAGQKGVKLNWQATWRNWMRNSDAKRTHKPAGHAATDSFLAGWGLDGNQDARGSEGDCDGLRDVTPPGDDRMAAGQDWDASGAILRFPTAAGNGPSNF